MMFLCHNLVESKDEADSAAFDCDVPDQLHAHPAVMPSSGRLERLVSSLRMDMSRIITFSSEEMQVKLLPFCENLKSITV